MNQLITLPRSSALPTLIAAAGDHASVRFLEFFVAQIRNPHTRRTFAAPRKNFGPSARPACRRSLASSRRMSLPDRGRHARARDTSLKQRRAAIRYSERQNGPGARLRRSDRASLWHQILLRRFGLTLKRLLSPTWVGLAGANLPIYLLANRPTLADLGSKQVG
jgi:hypothetical protein